VLKRNGFKFARLLRCVTIPAALVLGTAGCVTAQTGELAPTAPVPTAAQSALLFGDKEVRSPDIARFHKWTDMLARFHEEASREERSSCAEDSLTACPYTSWFHFLNGLKERDRMSQVTEVNRYVNRATYQSDDETWGIRDRWATPGEFLGRKGDCEDFAIAKYLSLRALGFGDDEVRMVGVRDMRRAQDHAVVAVRVAGTTYLLDNQIREVQEASSVKRYRPIFSITESYWVRYGRSSENTEFAAR
jgi:predicted transglutaminase-like cysteine proteinase